MTVTVKSFNSLWKDIRQLICHDTETSSGRTWIIKFHFNLRIFRIYTKSTGYGFRRCCCHRIKTFKLRQRVKSDVAAILQERREILLGISRRISMCPTSEFFISQPGFIFRTGRCKTDIFTEYRKRFPHGKCLKCQDNLYTCLISNLLD